MLSKMKQQAEAISCAIKNKQLLVLMIDDCTTIHSHRRPTALATNNVLNMATIIMRGFYTESRIVCSKPIRSHGLICAFTRWRRVPFEGFLSAFYMGK